MVTVDIDKLITQFCELAERYLEDQDLRTALDLDDQSAYLMSASGHLMKRPELSGMLHDFRKAVRQGDHATAESLFRRISAELKDLRG